MRKRLTTAKSRRAAAKAKREARLRDIADSINKSGGVIVTTRTKEVPMRKTLGKSPLLDTLYTRIMDKVYSNDDHGHVMEEIVDEVACAGYGVYLDSGTSPGEAAEYGIEWVMNVKSDKIWQVNGGNNSLTIDYYMAGEEEECAKRLMEILAENQEDK